MTVYNRVTRFWFKLLVLLPSAWFFLFVLLPFLLILVVSVSATEFAQPPYKSILSFANNVLQIKIHLNNYISLLSDAMFFDAYVNSLVLSLLTAVLCLFIAFPLAYFVSRTSQSTKMILLIMVIVPSIIAFIIRVYAWMECINVFNHFNCTSNLLSSIHQDSESLQADSVSTGYFGVLLVMVHSYLPFMFLPLYSAIDKIPSKLIEAAYDLGCRPFQTFVKVIFPLAHSGVLTGCAFVIIPAMGEFIIPDLLGGGRILVVGQMICDELFLNRDWPAACSVTIVMLAIISVFLLALKSRWGK
jgi:putrescine transport system permease protein